MKGNILLFETSVLIFDILTLKKRYRVHKTDLWERERVGRFGRMALKQV